MSSLEVLSSVDSLHQVTRASLKTCNMFVLFSRSRQRPFYGDSFLRPDGSGLNHCDVIVEKVTVAKNPYLHPCDIRVLRAVDVPALYHMVDCIVFPQKGERRMDSNPHQMNLMSYVPHHDPSFRAFPSHMKVDPTRSPLIYDSWPSGGTYGYLYPPQCHGCSNHDYFPDYYGFRPPYPHFPLLSPLHCHSSYPMYPGTKIIGAALVISGKRVLALYGGGGVVAGLSDGEETLLGPAFGIPMPCYVAEEPRHEAFHIEEVKEYFSNYTVNDSLGIIANTHTVFVDREPKKAMSGPCLEHSKLFLVAVDFPNTLIQHFYHLIYESQSI
ncbi:hypothetical protein RJ639_047780 [Escallonia herrerae]|uniref:RNA-dependent RNA polymerase n=1 Tax=Escallonia herrerae TaxID=1293975 RepID=A0AA88W8M4_9ASTE|nr:hypothetical protein RJ639_047780 [Escallonia herrerae]